MSPAKATLVSDLRRVFQAISEYSKQAERRLVRMPGAAELPPRILLSPEVNFPREGSQ